ncbi:RNA polymerase factor sigma-54 [Virgibacillus soli]|uniref:RNA polymerase factor sigma-54 n=1 Tax=Paracerasibacillus soli TaxID=480284 RepID=A0ABU5CR93_9BACI|nr:RNA polymerase factor sigma-54 [Virgibacillus soli]MDY0408864.1 RNA polymerase factor sigma-54 [Virgibacillus soli]
MKQRLVQEQTLQLKMNQSLLQAIKILQLSSVELIDYIKELVKENPLIEEINYDYEINHYRVEHPDHAQIGEMNAQSLTMYEQLRNQLYTVKIPKALLHVVEFGIDSLNKDGYLDITLEEWAKQCDVSVENAEEALSYLQQMDPPGIGARSLTECIILQLRESKQDFVVDLLQHHLDWVAQEEIDYIAAHYGVSEDIVRNVLNQIKACHPKPGSLLATDQIAYIVPEAAIIKENDKWKVSFYKWYSPRLTINPAYLDLIEKDKEAATYLKEKRTQMERVNEAISYRGHTLEQIIKKVLEKQVGFFEFGPTMLQSLTLKEIADALQIHISTVSRAINSKYIQTPHGVVPIKFFFQSGLKQGGKQTSSYAIKHYIKEIIHQENKAKPLSDAKICKILNEDYGITIARRTVMKYREQLHIPSSMKRK